MNKKFLVLIATLLLVSHGFAQERRGQIEFYGGAAFPLGPDVFKDFYKIGLSGNFQYVLFPSPSIGIPIFVGYERFTVDKDAIAEASAADLIGLSIFDGAGNVIGTVIDGSIDADGSASAIKFGIGVRPYLTSPEAPTQFFLFGTATYNLLKLKSQIKDGSYVGRDFVGNQQTFNLTQQDIVNIYGGTEFKEDDNKFGLAGGAGLELPAGESLNLIIQGLFNVIFTDEDKTTFIGVTAGLVF
jgi:hypothetical protein